MKRASRRLVLGGLVAGGVLIGLGWLHRHYPLAYVYRVLIYQEADFDDILRFPSATIGPSQAPLEWEIEPLPRVANLVEQHPRVDTLEALLQESQTSAFLIVHRGVLVAEHYFLGHDHTTPQNTFSISKSITSALMGLAIQEGLLDLDDRLAGHLPELGERDVRFNDITLGQLLGMRSGIRYEAGVPFPFVNADDALIYYHPDLESLLLQRAEVAGPPGRFRYNLYNPPLLGLVLRRACGIPTVTFLEQRLWQPLGAECAAGWTVDDQGFERMESGFHGTARDLAKLGQLYLDGGMVDDRILLEEDWILRTTEVADRGRIEANGRGWLYGLGWWVVPRPEGRSDFTAIGRDGQFLYVSPQYGAVILRTGPGRGAWGDQDWTELFYRLAERL